jgi:hypothetical protein
MPSFPPQPQVEYYEFHDKYSFVGRLQNTTGAIERLVDDALLAQQQRQADEEKEAAEVEMALEAEAIGDYQPPKIPEPERKKRKRKKEEEQEEEETETEAEARKAGDMENRIAAADGESEEGSGS